MTIEMLNLCQLSWDVLDHTNNNNTSSKLFLICIYIIYIWSENIKKNQNIHKTKTAINRLADNNNNNQIK